MSILRNILSPLQQEFGGRCNGDERGAWFVYTLLAVVTHFTSSHTASLLRCLQTLFGLQLSKRRFYTFMASSKLPWPSLWTALWSLIPNPTTAQADCCWRWMILSIQKLAKRSSGARLSLTMPPRPTNPTIPGRRMWLPSVC